jgi:hypothetical protein
MNTRVDAVTMSRTIRQAAHGRRASDQDQGIRYVPTKTLPHRRHYEAARVSKRKPC